MQNFNHSNDNNSQNNNQANNVQNNGQMNNNQPNNNQGNQNQQRQSNNQRSNNSDGFFTKAVNWGVSLAVKYGKTFEIVIWALTIIGILFIPFLALAMTYFAYCYSKINPSRGHIMMAVALIGGIGSMMYNASQRDNSSDGEVWYFWTE